MIERERRIELLERALGIRHKLKVYDSMKHPETHEEIAITMLAKWELEDELRAIDELLAATRDENVKAKRKQLDGGAAAKRKK
jgi:hypothetical protein